ncbi:hypothetical protein F2P81_017042 [Scophthalmus maximus]|uniref:Sortilin-related receptor n=1 Tax=Scophthalmus maximus TaxID=52904 RepID=A0A6A4SGL3_SCOMX|nr:hypothetical protein F2P81_017042 [Scophthalmus maximus]
MLPQSRGFRTIEANADAAAAPPLPAADRGASAGGSDAGTHPQHRSRRSAGEPAAPKVYGQANLNDSHNQMVVHWAGEKSNVIVALARDSAGATGPRTSSVYVSYDYGTTFMLVSDKFQLSGATFKDGSKQVISQFYHSPADNRRMLFTLVTDTGTPYMGRGVEPHDPPTTVLVQRHEPQGVSTVLSSTDFFQSEQNRRVILEQVDSFQLRDKYMFATTTRKLFGSHDPSSVQLWVSYNRQPMKAAQFMTRHPITSNRVSDLDPPPPLPLSSQQEYYIADASEDQVFVYFANEPFADLHRVEGLRGVFIATLINGSASENNMRSVITFDKGGTWELLQPPAADSLGGTVDCQLSKGCSLHLAQRWSQLFNIQLRRMPILSKDSAPGVIMATAVSLSRVSSNIQTSSEPAVTHERNLVRPEAHQWSPFCSLPFACTGRVYESWYRQHLSRVKRRGFVEVLYLDSLKLNFVNRGKYFARACNGHMHEKDAEGNGLSSRVTLFFQQRKKQQQRTHQDCNIQAKSPCKVRVCEMSVSPLIAGSVGKNLASKPNVFSTNEGETWTDFPFSDREVYVYQLLTEPGEKSTIFTIFGSYANQRHSWLILQVNTSDVLGVPCSDADYKRWSPSDEHGNECLLGREITFKRRAPHATCFNGEDFDRPVTIANCSCTRQDYECDYGFKLSEDLSLQVCVPDPEFLGDLYAPPVPCPIGTTYRRSKGYRRVPGDSCSGGDVESRLDGEMLPCPVGESNEFILYAVRNSIHRYDLATGTDQALPLAGLREAVALDFDYDKNCLYWADISLDTIQRLCLNGSTGQEVVVRKDLQNVEALTFDPVSNPDGDVRHTLLNSSVLEHPRALVLLPGESLMFWTDWGDRAAGVYRSYMDGTNVSCIVSEGVRWPNGITADDRWLYWTEAYSDRIERADFNGGQRSVLMDGLPHPYAIAVFKNDLYWDDWSRMGIFKAPKAGSQSNELIVGRLTGVMDLKIFYKGKNRGHNACADQPCSLLCLPQPGHRHTCVCPDGTPTVTMPNGELQCQCPTSYQLQNNTCVKTEHSCLPNQYRCSNGRCISSIWKCDSDNDCGDMSDEQECPTTTCDPSNQFRCVASGSCIPLAFKCDHEDDCGDNSDEEHCESHQCGPGEFTCARGVCIREAWRCDGDNDCRDWSDEANCTVGHHTCEASSFQCHTGHCIPQRWMCDGDDDCQDDSDEDPQHCEGTRCKGFLCSNDTCLPATVHCNGIQECPDGADEHNCDPLCTRYMEFVCKNRAQCLFQSLVCDGIKHCEDGSDEDAEYAGCATPSEFGKVCDAYTFQCANGVCVSLEWKCDGMDDCGDYSDEANCAAPTEVPGCSRYFQYECRNGRCIPTWWKCDGENDCGDWSDEAQCTGAVTPHTVAPGPSTCAPNRFHCGSGACIINTWVCDGYADCPDGSDELGCPTAVNGSVTVTSVPTLAPPDSAPGRCNRGQFLCRRPPRCIPDWQRCDGQIHCEDRSDEDHCPTRGPLFCTNGTRCSDGEACVLDGERCDGFLDCSDHSDEDNCTQDTLAYKVQNLQWTPDVLGAITLTWSRPKNLPLDSCYFLIYYRLVGMQQWTIMDTHSNKTSYKLTVLKPDTTYHVKVLTQCLSKLHKTNEVITVRTPEGALPPPSVIADSITTDSMSLSFSLNSQYNVKQYIVILSWQFDKHVKESRNYTVIEGILKATNLTAGTVYEVAVWAHTSIGDSPTALSHHQTAGAQPERPLLKARALNQTAVDCSWTVSGPPAQVRAVSPSLGPPSDYAVVKMIPNERLPPRNLHRVRVDKTQATLKWQPPYDAPNTPLVPLLYIRCQLSVSFSLPAPDQVSPQVGVGSLRRPVPLQAPEALKILTEKDHVFLFWKSLAVREKDFNETRGYEVHVYDSVTNQTSYLGNTTETYFRISSLLLGHNYTFSVQARCLLGGQLCGEPALLLYNQLTAGASDASRSEGHSGDMAAVVVPVLFLLLLGVCGSLVALYLRHRRLQNNFTAFANSHYNSRLGSAIFSSGDELGDDDEDAPMISGFSDDVPMVIA